MKIDKKHSLTTAYLIMLIFTLLIISSFVALFKTLLGEPYLFETISLFSFSFISLLITVTIINIGDLKDIQNEMMVKQIQQGEILMLLLNQTAKKDITSGGSFNLMNFINKDKANSTYSIEDISFEVLKNDDITNLTIQELKEKLSDAILDENYEQAGVVRDELRKREM